MTIEESNKLIAEFDLVKKFNYNVRKNGVWKEGRFYYWKDVKYHSSWEWLMPVVEKIEQTLLPGYKYTHDDKPASFRVAIFVRCCDICVANSTGDNLIEITAAPSKIDAVYNAVVQFIQWYNTQNTSRI